MAFSCKGDSNEIAVMKKDDLKSFELKKFPKKI